MSKHNKKRNTGFLMRALLREVAEATVDRNEKRANVAKSLMKKYFKSGTEMAKDLDCYNSLLESHNLKENTAERLLNEAKKTFKNINKGRLFNEQTRLINEINNKLSQDVFSNFIKDYRSLASIYKILNEEKASAKERVKLEENILDRMQADQKVIKESKVKPVDSLTYKTFVQKFNDKYEDSLLKEQRLLVQHYLTGGKDSPELKMYVNDEISRLKKKMSEALSTDEFVKDEEMQNKGEQVVELLENYKEKSLDSEGLQKILEIQDLVSEIFEVE